MSHFQRVDLNDILPFALISPEVMPERVLSKLSRRPTATSQISTTRTSESELTSPVNRNGQSHLPYLDGPPADLRGIFMRKFRWGDDRRSEPRSL